MIIKSLKNVQNLWHGSPCCLGTCQCRYESPASEGSQKAWCSCLSLPEPLFPLQKPI